MVRTKKVNGKKKGSKFELDIAKQIAATINEPYGTMVRRTPGSGSLLCRSDLWVHSDVRHKFNWFLELKKREHIRLEHLFKENNYLTKWYEDSREKLNLDPEYDPMTTPTALVFAKNNMTPFILMSEDDFCNTDAKEKYPKTALRIYFSDNRRDYVVLDWALFLKIYAVNP